ncbi:MAG: hypothetical protein RLN75_01365 [Longimicrobiales bacterium]
MTLRFVRSPLGVSAAGLALVLVGCAASGADPAPSPSAAPSSAPAASARASTLADGAFSAEQAARGAELFGQVCGDCHATREFRGTDFFFAWEGSTVGRFVQVVAETMPEDDPGGLPMDQYLAVAAYVLDLNDFPAGSSPLPDDADYLGSLRIARPGAAPLPTAAFPAGAVPSIGKHR